MSNHITHQGNPPSPSLRGQVGFYRPDPSGIPSPYLVLAESETQLTVMTYPDQYILNIEHHHWMSLDDMRRDTAQLMELPNDSFRALAWRVRMLLLMDGLHLMQEVCQAPSLEEYMQRALQANKQWQPPGSVTTPLLPATAVPIKVMGAWKAAFECNDIEPDFDFDEGYIDLATGRIANLCLDRVMVWCDPRKIPVVIHGQELTLSVTKDLDTVTPESLRLVKHYQSRPALAGQA